MRFASLCICFGVLLSSAVQGSAVNGPATFDIVALSGQALFPGGDVARTFRHAAINDQGQVAFRAYPLVDSDAAILAGLPGGLRVVVREGAATPTGANPTFGVIGSQFALSDNGFVAFSTKSGGTTASTNSVWVEAAVGSLVLAAQGRNQAPGLQAGTIFTDFTESRLSLAANGRLLMYGAIGVVEPNGTSTTTSEGFWTRPASGSLTLLGAVRQSVAPNGSGELLQYIDATMTANGTIYVDGSTANTSGVWSGSSYATLASRAMTSTLTSSIGGSVQSFRVIDPTADIAVADDGSFLIRAAVRLSSVPSSVPLRGLWRVSSNNVLTPIAIEDRTDIGTPTGQPAGSRFTEPYPEFTINRFGAGSLRSTFGVPGEPFQKVGLWAISTTGQKQLIAATGMQVPDAPTGVTFGGRLSTSSYESAFDIPVINSLGQIAFLAGLTGTGVNDSNDTALFARDRQGTLEMIVRAGDFMDVAPGDSRLVKEVYFAGGGTDGYISSRMQSLNTGLNDRGDLIFAVDFWDGSAGVFVAHVSTIPEPSTCLLFAGASLAVMANRWWRRRAR